MILLPKLYRDKKICLLGSGQSAEKYNIIYKDYDLIVGINRIYHSNYIDNINVIYYNLSTVDAKNIEYMLKKINQKEQFRHIIFCPWLAKRIQFTQQKIQETNFKKEYTFCRKIVRQIRIKNRPLTGIAALNHIILSGAKQIEMFGFDFYQNRYINNMKHHIVHDRFHDIKDNIRFLNEMMQKHNIIWHK